MNAVDRKVFGALATAADAGSPTPRNAELARLIGSRSISTASIAVSRLEAAGLIRVERTRTWRVITIAASGAQTARPARADMAYAMRDALADFIADGGSQAGFAARHGLSIQRVSQLWADIVRSLGWQAS